MSIENDGELQIGQNLTIRGRKYLVLEQLSHASRGRWRVRDPQPYPRGTLMTALVLEDSPDLHQLERSLRRLPRVANGIPHLISVGFHKGKRVLIISWQEGNSVEAYLKRVYAGTFDRPSVWESIRRMRSLAHSLKVLYCHCQLVHGDIKPGNLILPNIPGSISLIDYGSSWQAESTTSRLPGDGVLDFYAAPELLNRERAVDFRADQFSTGVILFELLTLTLPFGGIGGKAGREQDRTEMEGEYQPPSELLSRTERIPKSIMAEIDSLVGRTLKLDPKQRFETPQAFCDAMDSVWFRLSGSQDRITERQRKHLPRNFSGALELLKRFVGR